jgi:hypothetical protein
VNFEEFSRRREAERAERDLTRVTWRRAEDHDRRRLYSGLGSGGRLVYAQARGTGSRRVWDFGRIVRDPEGSPLRQRRGSRDTLREAKLAAAALLSETP